MGIFFLSRGTFTQSIIAEDYLSFFCDRFEGWIEAKLRLLVSKGIFNLLGRGKKRIDT